MSILSRSPLSMARAAHNRFMVKVFLIALVVIAVASGLMLYGIYQNSAALNESQMISKEDLMTDLTHDQITTAFEDIGKLVIFLSKTPAVNNYINEPNPENYKRLANTVISFAGVDPYLDQLRVLDAVGNELLRVNNKDGKHIIVARDDLQYKGDRYYVQELNATDKGSIYISKMDLNIENGQLEIPYKPTIRIGLPLYTIDGVRFGSLLINVDINKMFDDFIIDEKTKTILGSILITDEHGHYQFNEESPDTAYGDMLPERSQFTFPSVAPEVWPMMTTGVGGSMMTKNGLYTYRTINLTSLVYPLDENGTVAKVNAIQPIYYVVLHLSSPKIDLIKQNMNTLIRYLIITFLIAIPLLAYGVAILSSMLQENTKYFTFFAEHDSLTGLGNRRFIASMYGEGGPNIRKFNGTVFFFDLDGFKNINDSYGHRAGDETLKNVAVNLRNMVRPTDSLARIGGDEFVIVTSNPMEKEEGLAFGQRIIEAIQQPQNWNGNELHISASVGVFSSQHGAVTLDEAISRADNAMYKGKDAGKSRVMVWEAE